MAMPARLLRLNLWGLKTVRELEGFELRPLNVMIGANGAGKSNFISFFKLLNWIMAPPGGLQVYVGKTGGANVWLHDGAGVTPQIEAFLSFETEKGQNEYSFRLFHAAMDTFVFADEQFRFWAKDLEENASWTSLGAGHREAQLIERAGLGEQTPRVILSLLRQCVVYQFHNTSETARIRSRWDIEDSRYLKEDGANLASLLYRLQNEQPPYYHRIVATIRQIAPFFADFVLEPTDGRVLLQWRERESDMVFGAHQASDGTLRMMALVTLLLQPEESLPALLILDEPELGLHPFAITIVAGLLKSVCVHRQVVLATQSALLIDHFEPEDIIVVERPGRNSTFARLDHVRLSEWAQEYSLAELWEKNVIGGRPR